MFLRLPSKVSIMLVLSLISNFGCAEPQIANVNSTADKSSSAKTEQASDPRQQAKVLSQEQNFDSMSDEEADAWLLSNTTDSKVALTVGEVEIRVEYADTFEKRQLGLMFRRELCESCGMLFKFESPRIGSIWMKNTYIPLDLAYIDKDGKIVDIKQLQPHELNPVRSSSLVLYALEMNKGWFAKHDLRVGDTVKQLP